MAAQGESSFGHALSQAIRAKGTTQAALARKLRIDPSRVARWVKNEALPHEDYLHGIEEFLGADLSDSYKKSEPKYELFVSAPISGLAEEDIPGHHDAVAKVVRAASQHVNRLVWPGERVKTATDRLNAAADIVTERNMRTLASCPAYLYLQFADIVGPSSALVELGFALGKRMKITIMFKDGLTIPYMLRGFGGVAANLRFLPPARIYPVASVDVAASLIEANGREMLGLT
jgi:transcriptional regulator with XRE-family HTH domain